MARWMPVMVLLCLVLALCAGCGGDGMRTQALNVSGTLAVKFIAGFENGAWSNLGGGFDTGSTTVVRVIKRDPITGRLWIGGRMTLGGTTYRVCTYDAVNGLQGVDDGPDDGVVYDILIHPDGTYYFVGTFTTCTGTTVAAKYICQYDGSSTWAAVGAGTATDGTGTAGLFSIDIDPDTGKIYVGGNIAAIGGTTAYNVAEWDGSSWSALGTELGFNGGLNDVTVHDGWLYALGIFTETYSGGVTGLGRFAKFELGVSSEWEEASPSGLNNFAYQMTWLPNGTAVIGGTFTTADGVTANRLALFNGNGVVPLGDGTGANGTVRDVAARSDGKVLIIGDFTTLGGMAIADYCGLWDGSGYSPLTIDLPGTPTTYTADTVDVGGVRRDMYIGFSTEGDADVSQLNSVTNAGSAKVFPKFVFERSGGTSATLESIINHTTGDQLLFNHPMQDGERLTIDLTPGNKTFKTRIGSTEGNALNDLLGNSDISTFGLAPGTNQIEVYISAAGSPTITAFIQWETEYVSIDGGAG